MDFKSYLLQQIKRHPSMQAQDVVKLCYQSAYGAEHLLNDPDQAWVWLENEFAGVDTADSDLYEVISAQVCRINLAAWKYRKLPLEWLFRMFAESASVNESDSELFLKHLEIAEELVARGKAGVSLPAWYRYLEDYKASGMKAVHHSECYRQKEKPAYRIIRCQFLRLLPILEEITHKVKNGQVCVIAIDGRAASGKSTLAKALKTVINASIVQMDDFFLPSTLRTEERFISPGGNIHYERFLEEVIPYIAKQEPFSYGVFDCGKMELNGEKTVDNKQFRIVEGSYSCHPVFGQYADITVFLQVEPEEQMHRILYRNGPQMAGMFQQKWIPLEEAYFDHYSISEKADLRL